MLTALLKRRKQDLFYLLLLFKYSDGDLPYCFLKHLEKYPGEEKPTRSLTAFFKRVDRINSVGVWPVIALIFRYTLVRLIKR